MVAGLLSGCEPVYIERSHSDAVTQHILVAPDDADLQEVFANELNANDLIAVAQTMRSLRSRMPTEESYVAVNIALQRLAGLEAEEHPDYWYAIAATNTTLALYRLNGYPVGDNFAEETFQLFQAVLQVGDGRAREEALRGIGGLGIEGSSRVLGEHAMKWGKGGDFSAAISALVTTCDADAGTQLDAMASAATDQDIRQSIRSARQSRLEFWKNGRRVCEGEIAVPPWPLE